MKISVAKDFSQFPAGRFRKDGPWPGEKFRDEHLVPALKQSSSVTVQLDGTMGYGSSFLEEAFGGLVRLRGFTADALRARRRLVVESTDPSLVREVWSYIDDASPE